MPEVRGQKGHPANFFVSDRYFPKELIGAATIHFNLPLE